MNVAQTGQIGQLRQLDETLWEIPGAAREDMRVPARVFADREILEAILGDRSLEQLQNVATLPGIVEAALANELTAIGRPLRFGVGEP